MRVAPLRVASFVALITLPAFFLACGSNRSADTESVTGSVDPGKTVVGGIGHSRLGGGLDGRERQIAAEAEFRALEYGKSGVAVDWTNPATRHRGSIIPGRPYQAGNHFCRSYTHTVHAGASPDVAKATACRSPNGTWRSVG